MMLEKRFHRLIGGLVILVALMSLVTPAAWAAPQNRDPSEPIAVGDFIWDIQFVDGPELFTDMTDRSLRLDSFGYPHIVFGGNRLMYAAFDGSNSDLRIADNGPGVGRYAALALDSDDHAHISYYDAVLKNLKYAQWTGSQWILKTVVSAQA